MDYPRSMSARATSRREYFRQSNNASGGSALVRFAAIIQEQIEDTLGVTMDKRGQLKQTKMLMWSGRVVLTDGKFPQPTHEKNMD
jgi:hypothetical protein